MSEKFVVIGTKWHSGLAMQYPAVVGPLSAKRADAVASLMDEQGFVGIDIEPIFSLKEFKEEYNA